MKTKTITNQLALVWALAAAICVSIAPQSHAVQRVRVDITNNAPVGGVALTPVWIGFHSGNFDTYNGGLPSLPGLESIAEDGSATLLSTQFNDVNANGGYTYIDNSGMSATSALVRTGDPSDSNRQDATLGSTEITPQPPLTPGESTSAFFDLETDGTNNYISYVSMVLPTNDFFVANGNPLAHSIASLLDGSGSISFNIGGNNASPVNDAGTEAESYVTSAGNGLFGLAGGQNGPDQPAGSLGLPIANVNGPLPLDALNFIEGSQPNFDFNDAGLYPNGIATITVTAIPEPTSIVLASFALASCGMTRRRR